MLKTEAGRVTAQVVILSVYSLTALWVIPELTKLFPKTVPGILIETLAIVISSAILCTIWAVLSRNAWVRVKWTTLEDSKELNEVSPRIQKTTKSATESFWVHAEFDRAWGIGWVILRLAVRRGLWIKITAPHSSLVLQVDDVGTIDAEEPSVRSGQGCTLFIKLAKPVPEPDRAWNSAYVRVDGKRPRPDEVATLYYTAEASGKLFGWICHRYLKVDTKAVTIREQWR